MYYGRTIENPLLLALLGESRSWALADILDFFRPGGLPPPRPPGLGAPAPSWDFLGLPATSWDLLGHAGVSWGLLGPRGASWSLLGPPGASWGFLRHNFLSNRRSLMLGGLDGRRRPENHANSSGAESTTVLSGFRCSPAIPGRPRPSRLQKLWYLKAVPPAAYKASGKN